MIAYLAAGFFACLFKALASKKFDPWDLCLLFAWPAAIGMLLADGERDHDER